ncbi:hypothetical protein KSP39_PZI021488 [Platanthera zijinensis]|uniref:Ycf3-interacting protein 1, chloroplastic n=1 Tax=Platanthera zijinensis TaxID=2320716 RepID=A0AAP0AXT2_9ASPA
MSLRFPPFAFEAPPFALYPIPSASPSSLLGSSPIPFSARAPPLHFRRRNFSTILASIGKEGTELRFPGSVGADLEVDDKEAPSVSGDLAEDASPEELEYIRQINRVLELLKKNRDMLFDEVKLTIMIEDPRDVERKRMLGIEDADEVTRDDLASALEDVHEGRIPKNRVALRLLAEEIINWPNLEVEAPKSKRTRSLYAKATDTGVDPREAAKRLNVDWDKAADIEAVDEDDDIEVPSVVGYSALYLVTALPLIIGVSVVLVLFYNSLQ